VVYAEHPTGKNLEIEVLRCFAVVFVICGHSHNLMPWHDGLANTSVGFWTGVDVFLCISGFVITKAFSDAIRRAAQAGRRAWLDEVTRFLVRRAFRLLPASLFWIVVAYLVSHFFNRSGAFGSPAQNLQDAAAILLSVANIYFAACITGAISGCGPNAIYWTVSLEQQFYVLFPALILLRNRAIVIICVLVFVFFAFVPKNVWIYYNRADTLAVGVVIGLLSHSTLYRTIEPRQLLQTIPRAISTAALLGFLLFGTAGIIALSLFPVVPALVTIVCGLIVLLVSYDRGYLFGPGTCTGILATIGTRSYSIYLTHNLAMAASTETFLRMAPRGTIFGSEWDAPMIVLAVLYLAVFTEASYRIIEIPFRTYGRLENIAFRPILPTPLE
jgi:peptidoglycan/LPS O-acetylase OafA/YrhL